MQEVSFDQVGTAVALLVVLLGLVWLVMGLIKAFRPNPPNHEIYASKAAVQRLEDDVEDVIQQLQRQDEANRFSRKRMHADIEGLGRELSSVGTKAAMTHDTVIRMEGMIQKLIENKPRHQ